MEKKPSSMIKFLDQFKSIPRGTKIYTLKAHLSPSDKTGMTLGDLVISKECVTNNFGDTKLAFKHQWIEEDIKLKPEWSSAYYNQCYCNVP